MPKNNIHQDYRITDPEGASPTLNANRGGGAAKHPYIPENSRIRRLMPIECMRLMSWPDNHCDLGDYGDGPKPISDSQKYKMAGNGVVSEVVAAIITQLYDLPH